MKRGATVQWQQGDCLYHYETRFLRHSNRLTKHQLFNLFTKTLHLAHGSRCRLTHTSGAFEFITISDSEFEVGPETRARFTEIDNAHNGRSALALIDSPKCAMIGWITASESEKRELERGDGGDCDEPRRVLMNEVLRNMMVVLRLCHWCRAVVSETSLKP